jgi:MarR family transcriptional regulator, temperature-dependent positive regulator of motility
MPRAAKSLPSPIHLLHRASQRADGLFARHVGEVELTPRQFAVLEAVAGQSGLCQTDIMAATGIDRSSTAELVRRLVSNGCLQRRRTRRDTRVYAVRITTRGRELLSIGASATRVAEDALLMPVAPNQRARFLETLINIVSAQEK